MAAHENPYPYLDFSQKELEKIEYLKSIDKPLLTDQVITDDYYSPEDAEYNKTVAYLVKYVNRWHYAENSNPHESYFTNIHDALVDMRFPGDYNDINKNYEPIKTCELVFEKVLIDANNEITETDDQYFDYYSVQDELPDEFKKVVTFNDYEIAFRNFDSKEQSAQNLENEVYFNINNALINEYEGIEIHCETVKKYRDINLYKNGDYIGKIQLRIADHSYNPRNNDIDAHEGKFISVEIANKNETANRFNGKYGIQFNGEDTFADVVEAVNLRITEIIDNHFLESLSGLPGSSQQQFVERVKTELSSENKHNKRSIEKLAEFYGITDQNHVKELTELAIVQQARQLALQSNKTTEQKFYEIVELYKNQVNLSHRTSRSILLQQYSTPAPIAYMMGVYVASGTSLAIQLGSVKSGHRFTKNHFRPTPSAKTDKTSLTLQKPFAFFEPSAGNGLLTIAIPPKYWHVNEIDEVRRANLQTQGYASVTDYDASLPIIFQQPKMYDGVITNPPFGRLDSPIKAGGFLIDDLDHLMAVYALENMKDNGKAAIIVGGHISYDPENGRIKQQGEKGGNRNFYNFLYRNYNVEDILYINGDLYSRQGTSFDVRIILINGRKPQPEGFAPRQTSEMNKVINTWNEFYKAISKLIKTESQIENKDVNKQSLEQKYAKMIVDQLISDDKEMRKRENREPLTDDKYNEIHQTDVHERGFLKLKQEIDDKDYTKLSQKLYPHNKFWRKYFEEYTGMKLDKTMGKTLLQLQQYTGYVPEPIVKPAKISKQEALERAKKAKDEKVLNTRVKYDGGIIRTRKENVEYILSKGGYVEIAEVPSVKAAKNYNNMSWNEQREYERKRSIMKPEYRLYTSSEGSTFYEITKAEYDYAIEFKKNIADKSTDIDLLSIEFEMAIAIAQAELENF